ncbi:MAG: FapA family protein [Peptococcaceae bacterium]|jgi:septum formation inhibitor MinC|nr:FapA family protein [Peptococcaceae bacterium]
MSGQVVQGKSLEEIRKEWAERTNCAPDKLELEVLEKPSLLNRKWKVSIRWPESEPESEAEDTALKVEATAPKVEDTVPEIADKAPEPERLAECTRTDWLEDRYRLTIGARVQTVVPHPQAGQTFLNDREIEERSALAEGDRLEFKPLILPGRRTWQLEVRDKGFKAVAAVKHEKAKKACLAAELYSDSILNLSNQVRWETGEEIGEFWTAERYAQDLAEKKIVHGGKENAWDEIIKIEDFGEVVVAEGTLSFPAQPPVIQDCVNAKPALEEEQADDKNKIDYFASKIVLIEKGAVLARKTPGIPGIPGIDVFGQETSVKPLKDIPLKPKKNVRLSDDGLELIAECAGRPVRIEANAYAVEEVFMLRHDVDLSTGSIDFPGNVLIQGDVQDGLHIFSGGNVEISGSVSHAEIRGDKGVKIRQTVHGGKITVGYQSVVKSEIASRLQELHGQVLAALKDTDDLHVTAGENGFKPGQCLKLILEKRYSGLPKQAVAAEEYLTANPNDKVTEELSLAVRVIRHSLSGLEPLKDQSVQFLRQASGVLAEAFKEAQEDSAEEIVCDVSYIQGAVVESSGAFRCEKAVYNCSIKAEKDVLIKGVCRGGKIIAGGNVIIQELGGSGVSSTLVQISGSKRLSVGYCHPNVIIAVNKEIIKIEQAYKKLEVYREGGIVQMDKLLVHD